MINRKRIASQFAWVSGGRIVGALLQAGLLILLARNAGPSDFGLFSAVFSLATVVQTASGLGVPTLVIRERARSRNSPLLRGGLKLMNPIGVFLGGIVAVALFTTGLFFDDRLMYLVPLAIWAAVERYSDTWLGFAVADGDAHINTLNVVARRALALGLYIVLVMMLDPLLSFAIALSASAVCSAAAVRWQIAARVVLDGPSARTKEVLGKAWPFWLNSVGTQARNLDVAVVTSVAGLAQAGYYAAASRVTSPLSIVSTSLATVLLPMAASGRPSDIRRLLKLSVVVVLILTVLYSLAISVTPWIVLTFLSEAYVEATTPLQVVLIALCFGAGASLISALLQGIGLQLFVAHAAVVTTIICLITAAGGALLAGAEGAAWALVLSFATQLIVLLTRLICWLRQESGDRA